MEVKMKSAPFTETPSDLSTGSVQNTTNTTLQHLANFTMQSLLWDLSDPAMNNSKTQDVFSVDTSTIETIKTSVWYDFTSQSPLTTTALTNNSSHISGEPPLKFMVLTMIQAIVIIIGLIANALTVMVMLRPSTRSERMAVFLIPLALFDFIKLVTDFHMSGIIHFIPDAFDLSTYSPFTCGVFAILTFTGSYNSSWILVGIAAERAFAVVDPLRFKKYWTKKMSVTLALAIVVVCFLMSFMSLYVFELQVDPISGAAKCAFKQGTSEMLLAVIADSMIYSIVPSVALLILNALIIKGLRVAGNTQAAQANPARAAKERSASITIMAISLSFLVSVLPFGVYAIYYILPHADQDNHLWFEMILLSSLNHSMNFVFYIISGGRFRMEFLAMFGCCKVK